MTGTKKLTFSALVAAICTACLALHLVLQRVSLSVAALAGLFPAAIVILCGYGWACGTFAAAAALGLLLLPEKSAALWFAFFFGHYPIWKAAIERLQTRLGKPLIGWVLKLIGAAICVTLFWMLFSALFAASLPAFFKESTFGPAVVCLILVAAFLAYDVAFSILIGFFRIRILPKLK